MAQDYCVFYQGRLRRGQLQSAVASRLSEVLGRDRQTLEKLLSGPETVLLRTGSARQAQRLTAIFTEAGAEVRMVTPGEDAQPAAHSPRTVRLAGLKPAVPPSMGQRIWLLRAASVLLVVATLFGLAFGLLVTALIGLFFSYSRVLEHLPWPAVVLPVYVILIAVLLLVIAGLVKPFVPVESRYPRSLRLKRAHEPELFDFVDYICETIRVPYPRTLFVDMSATVHAGIAPGSELTIGLPVIASTTTAELGGIVASALTLHIGGVSGKLARFVESSLHRLQTAVHGRDKVDEALQRASEGNSRLLAHAAREFATLLRISRRLLGVVLNEAIGTSGAAMRAMEWHRDRHQARITGTEQFERSLQLMRLVRFTTDRAEASARELFKKGKPLPADLPGALALRMHALTRQQSMSQLLARSEEEQETVPQFHRPDAVRIERIRKTPSDATVTCPTPARLLMRGFSLHARRLTLLYYRHHWQLPVIPLQLQPRPSAEQRLLDEITEGAWLEQMFLNPRPFLDPRRTVAELRQERQRLKEEIKASSALAHKAIDRYREAGQLLVTADLDEVILRAGKPGRRSATTLEAVQSRCRALESSLEQAYAAATPHGELVSRYLACGAALLARPETAARHPKAPELSAQAKALMEALDKVQSQIGTVRELHLHASLLELLLTDYPDTPNSALKDRIAEQEADIQTHLTALRVALKRVRNPLRPDTYLFEHARASWVPTTPSHALLEEANVVLDGLLHLKGQMVARLAMLTQLAE